MANITEKPTYVLELNAREFHVIYELLYVSYPSDTVASLLERFFEFISEDVSAVTFHNGSIYDDIIHDEVTPQVHEALLPE